MNVKKTMIAVLALGLTMSVLAGPAAALDAPEPTMDVTDDAGCTVCTRPCPSGALTPFYVEVLGEQMTLCAY